MTKAITMPKWGLSMKEGLVGDWLVAEGAEVGAGTEVVLVETEKIAGGVEAAEAGTLRRAVAATGDTLPVGALLGVLAGADTPDAEVDAFVSEFQANFVPEETDAEEGGDQTETIQVGEFSVNYLRQGSGAKTAVLLHGFGGDLNNWLFNQAALAEHRTVIALDLPGHGLTTKKVANGNLLCMVHVLQNLMDRLGVAGADWVGHSMGGAIALQLALTRPDLVRSLTRGGYDARIRETLARFRLIERSDDLAGILSHGQQQWLEIAMALVRQPKLLLLDEPTAGMSPEERWATAEILEPVRGHCAMVIVEHDLDFIREICDRLTVLNQGVVVDSGTVAEIQNSEKVREVYLSRV